MRFLVFSVLLIALFGCSSNKDSVIILSNGQRLVLPYNQTVSTVITSEPPMLDWVRSSDTDSSWIEEHIMNGLVRFDLSDPQLKIEPALATKWESSEEGRVWTFYLRKGVLWTDGVEFKAQHIIDGWKRLLDPQVAAQAADNLYPIKGAAEYNQGKLKSFAGVGVKALDDYRVQVELVEPMVFFPLLMTHHTSFPVRQDLIDLHGDLWTEPENLVTLGPYKMIYWHHDSRIVLARNDSYWGKKPEIPFVNFYMIGKPSTSLRMFDRGKIDLMRDLPSSEIPRLSQKKEYHTLPGLRLYYYGFKIRKKPFDNIHLRKAIAHAIDRQEIVKVLGGGQYPLQSWNPPGMFGFNNSIGLEFNLEKANEHFKKSGVSSLGTVTLGFNTEEKHQRVAENIQAQLKKNLGLSVELKNEEWKTYLSGLRTDSVYSLFRLGWVADYSDPHTFMAIMTSHSPNNRTGWKNQEYDSLIKRGMSEADEQKRLETYNRAQEILVSEYVPAIPLFADVNQVLVSQRVENYVDNPLDLYLFQNMRLKP